MSKRGTKRVMTLEVEEELFEEFKRIAEEKGINRAGILRKTIKDFVRDNK